MVNSINFHGSDFLICQRNGSAYPTSLILSNSLPLANSQCIENPDLPPLTFQYELDAKQKEQGSPGRQPTALWVNLASIFECPDAIAVSKPAYVTCMSQTHSRLQLETHNILEDIITKFSSSSVSKVFLRGSPGFLQITSGV